MKHDFACNTTTTRKGAQWLSGRVLDSRPRGRGFEPHRRHFSLVLVQPRKTRPCLTVRLLMGRKESKQQQQQQHQQTKIITKTLYKYLSDNTLLIKHNAGYKRDGSTVIQLLYIRTTIMVQILNAFVK